MAISQTSILTELILCVLAQWIWFVFKTTFGQTACDKLETFGAQREKPHKNTTRVRGPSVVQAWKSQTLPWKSCGPTNPKISQNHLRSETIGLTFRLKTKFLGLSPFVWAFFGLVMFIVDGLRIPVLVAPTWHCMSLGLKEVLQEIKRRLMSALPNGSNFRNPIYFYM